MAPAERVSLFEFGPFRVDARRRLLWRGGELVDVPPKAVELLSALVEQVGQVVPKDELLRRVWPDTFVEEANLSVNVSILRKALGEQPDGQLLIQTVPRRGYRFLAPVAAVAAPAPRTLAVLPFRPLAAQEADEPLGLGLADALISRLAATGRIVVRPTAAVRRYGGAETDAVEAGRELRVDAILDARFRRSDHRLLVSAQLLPADGSSPLWAERFDEALTDVFAVEDALAERIAAALLVELSADERRRLGRRHTGNVEAWQAYARGRFFWGRFSRSWTEKALASFEQAAKLDPGYALPHAGLSDVFLVAGLSGAAAPRDAWEHASRALERARERDSQLPELHLSSGFLHLFRDWDWRSARSHFARALELSPLSAAPHQWQGLLLGLEGRLAEAHRALALAAEIDPLSPTIAGIEGLLLAFEGRHAEEVEQQRRTLDLDPQHFLGHWALGAALLNTGSATEAVASLGRAVELGGGEAFLQLFHARALARAGRSREARAILKRAPRTLRYQRAAVHAALGESRAALGELGRACDAREAWVVALHADPAFVSLRGEAAFVELARRVAGDQRATR
jgi:DNA-binding winged helix-turn-helix (wHTH) protein/tetratricopeptide (TPR) repeat protein